MIRGARGVASSWPSGVRRHRRRALGALFAVDDLLLELHRLLFNFFHCPRQRHIHIGVHFFSGQRVVSPKNHQLADVPVFLDGDNYVSRSFRAIENMIEFFEMIFDMFS